MLNNFYRKRKMLLSGILSRKWMRIRNKIRREEKKMKKLRVRKWRKIKKGREVVMGLFAFVYLIEQEANKNFFKQLWEGDAERIGEIFKRMEVPQDEEDLDDPDKPPSIAL